jgi:pantoate--beta-alanine ligase
VLSIFVNPAQFAPHEDYGTYPKTFEHDMERFRHVLAEFPNKSSPSLASGPSSTFGVDTNTEASSANVDSRAVVFLPSVKDMYPSGIVLDVADQKGTFVEVKGFGHQMEGKTRPTFFRGVATVSPIYLPPFSSLLNGFLLYTLRFRL